MSNWENFANENAEYYILTEEGVDYSTEEGRKFFFESGKEFTKHTMQNVSPLLKEKKNALEIGCGIGRLTLPHARLFDNISAVDISPTMLEKLKHTANLNHLTNINVFLPHENWDLIRYDYAYSYIVFQHIADIEVIEDYIKRIAKSLKKGGLAQLHFDTRTKSVLYHVRNSVPDFLLPKSQRKGIRRIRRSSKELRKLFDKNNLTISKEIEPDSEGHIFILEKI